MSAARVRDIRKRLLTADPSTLERLLVLMEPGAKPDSVNGVADSVTHLRPLLIGHHVEHFAVLFLNRRNRVIAAEVLSTGGTDYAVVDARVIFRRALILGAAAIIVGHNHPSGDASPSREDITVTERLLAAGEVLGIQVLDHLIVTNDGYTSMAADGSMPTRRSRPF